MEFVCTYLIDLKVWRILPNECKAPYVMIYTNTYHALNDIELDRFYNRIHKQSQSIVIWQSICIHKPHFCIKITIYSFFLLFDHYNISSSFFIE